MSVVTPPRAIQLDAQHLDDELQTLLLHEWRHLLRNFPRAALNRFTPEVTLVLRLLLHANSIAVNKQTPGNALQNLSYANVAQHGQVTPLSWLQRFGHLLLDVLVPYVISRLRHIRHASVSATVSTLDTVYKVVTLGNMLLFLRGGRYHTLTHRLLRSGLTQPSGTRPHRTAFEIVDRQLVWQGLAEFALFLAPVVKNVLKGSAFGRGVRRARGEGVCAGCGATAVMPHVAVPCRCRYCYVCGRDVLDGLGGFCRGCGGVVGGLERVRFA